MHPGAFVIRLNQYHRTARGCQIGPDHIAERLIIFSGFLQKQRVQIGHSRGADPVRRSNGRTRFIHSQDLRIPADQPGRQASVNQFGILIGAGAEQNSQPFLCRCFQKRFQIPVGAIPENKASLFRFMNQPRNIGRQHIASGFPKKAHSADPVFPRNTKIMELTGHHISRFTVQKESLLIPAQLFTHIYILLF